MNPYRGGMVPRRIALPLAVLLVAGLAGCAPTPAPKPTPTATGFASEDEAFAAAEETYRAYNNASNQVVLDDPETFEEVYAWATGEEAANVREDLTALASQGLTLTGQMDFDGFRGTDFDPKTQTVSAVVCVDASASDLIDADGKSVLPADRETLVSSDLQFAPKETSTALAVMKIERNSENGACAQ